MTRFGKKSSNYQNVQKGIVTIFWIIFWYYFKGGGKHTITTKGGLGWNLSVLSEGREAECYYSGRDERRTITTQGGVEGGCNSKHYWLMELLLDRINFRFAFAWQKNEGKPRPSAKIFDIQKVSRKTDLNNLYDRVKAPLIRSVYYYNHLPPLPA